MITPDKPEKENSIENLIEKIIFRSRWILAIFYLVLVLTLLILAIPVQYMDFLRRLLLIFQMMLLHQVFLDENIGEPKKYRDLINMLYLV